MERINFYENTCLRCDKTVYQVDKVGPLKDFTFFHKGCLRCATCDTKLTLKTYFNNQHANDDKEIYCLSHVPKTGPGTIDNQSVGIRNALNVPRSVNYVNEQVRKSAKATIDSDSLGIRPYLSGSRNESSIEESFNDSSYKYGRFDASALHIAHALKATELQHSYRKERSLDAYLVSTTPS